MFLTDFRYLERRGRCASSSRCARSREIPQPAAQTLAELIGPQGGAGFEGAHVSHADFTVLAQTVDANRLVSVMGAVESLRIVKDEEMVALVRRAAAYDEPDHAALADGVADRGDPERDIAWRVRSPREPGRRTSRSPPSWRRCRRRPAPRRPARRTAVERNQLVTIDLGCIVEGYRSDCTRTFTGLIAEPLSQAYQVLAAQLAGRAWLAGGDRTGGG